MPSTSKNKKTSQRLHNREWMKITIWQCWIFYTDPTALLHLTITDPAPITVKCSTCPQQKPKLLYIAVHLLKRPLDWWWWSDSLDFFYFRRSHQFFFSEVDTYTGMNLPFLITVLQLTPLSRSSQSIWLFGASFCVTLSRWVTANLWHACHSRPFLSLKTLKCSPSLV